MSRIHQALSVRLPKLGGFHIILASNEITVSCIPIGSMGLVCLPGFGWLFMVKVGIYKYTIHGSYGIQLNFVAPIQHTLHSPLTSKLPPFELALLQYSIMKMKVCQWNIYQSILLETAETAWSSKHRIPNSPQREVSQYHQDIDQEHVLPSNPWHLSLRDRNNRRWKMKAYMLHWNWRNSVWRLFLVVYLQ